MECQIIVFSNIKCWCFHFYSYKFAFSLSLSQFIHNLLANWAFASFLSSVLLFTCWYSLLLERVYDPPNRQSKRQQPTQSMHSRRWLVRDLWKMNKLMKKTFFFVNKFMSCLPGVSMASQSFAYENWAEFPLWYASIWRCDTCAHAMVVFDFSSAVKFNVWFLVQWYDMPFGTENKSSVYHRVSTSFLPLGNSLVFNAILISFNEYSWVDELNENRHKKLFGLDGFPHWTMISWSVVSLPQVPETTNDDSAGILYFFVTLTLSRNKNINKSVFDCEILT